MSIRSRAEARLVLACADVEDRLAAAKQAHTGEQSEESRAAKRQEMAALYETRAWLRAKDELTRLPGEIAEVERKLKHARLAKDEQAPARVLHLEGKLAAATAKLSRIQAEFGPLVAAMDELAAGGGS
jgi:hypothetical protein